MDRLNHSRKQKQLAPVKPCDVFDLIGGTSTGGLIAIMLGRLEMSVDECIKAYSGLIATVFGVQLSKIPMNWKGKVKPRFDSAKLEVAIKQVISQSGLPEDTMFDDGIERGCKTFVCSIDRHTKAMVRLRSYSLPDEQNVPATICQAALATSAATTFFAPVNIGKRSFADGAFGANNPVDEVEGEATNIWSPEMRELQPLVKCFISIGTGNPGIQAFEDGVPKFLGGTVPQIATETEATDRKFIARWARHFDEKRYFRFNVEQGLQGVGLAEYEMEGAIQAASEAYLTHTGQKSRVRDCVGNLSLKQKETDESFATIQREYVANVAQCLSQAKAARRTFYDIPPTAVSSFSGRKEILKQIDIAFSQVADATTKPPVLVLQAMGGQGKSQIALEYCRRSRSRFQAIFWIDATSDASVQGGFERIAKKFDPLAATGPRDRDEKIDLVQKKLANLEEEWLLVFDNYDDLSSYKLRPYLPTNGRGFIILTSRHEASGGYARPDKGNFLAVPSMEHDGGHVLLQNKLSGTNEQERSELLQRLGGLALAIDQAAAYISFHKLSIPDFMAAYESRKVKILQYYEKTDWEYNKHFNDSEKQIALTAYTTWEMSFQQVEPANPGRKEWITRFLSISAFLHPARIGEHIFREHYDNTYSPESDWLELFTSIPNNGDADEIGYQNSLRGAQKTKSKWLRFLRRKIVRSPKRTSSIIPGKKWESCQFQEVTRNLEKLSLVNNTDNCSGDTGLWFSIHPVIRDWLQIRMKSNLRQETLEESFRLIETVVALEVTKVAGADVNQELLAHVDILVDPLKALCKCGFLDDVFLGDSAIKFGHFYLDNGHHMKAIELLEYALDVVRASSAADKLVLRLEYTLAVVYNRDRHSSKAIELLEHVVRVQDLEETHHLRLASQHELAIAYQENGQVEDAIKLLEHVVQVWQGINEDHVLSCCSLS
ncbi:FabD/lysophospholipase-like protein [Aureobasidium pullulans]|nr:FabD/lysophospholipase-like protein [Aureobasidium pullulans]